MDNANLSAPAFACSAPPLVHYPLSIVHWSLPSLKSPKIACIIPQQAKMLTLTRKTDYALIALAFLAERGGRTASARQIAADRGLPVPILMNILKELHRCGILKSSRGTK